MKERESISLSNEEHAFLSSKITLKLSFPHKFAKFCASSRYSFFFRLFLIIDSVDLFLFAHADYSFFLIIFLNSFHAPNRLFRIAKNSHRSHRTRKTDIHWHHMHTNAAPNMAHKTFRLKGETKKNL